jgi:hypothetical protein
MNNRIPSIRIPPSPSLHTLSFITYIYMNGYKWRFLATIIRTIFISGVVRMTPTT